MPTSAHSLEEFKSKQLVQSGNQLICKLGLANVNQTDLALKYRAKSCPLSRVRSLGKFGHRHNENYKHLSTIKKQSLPEYIFRRSLNDKEDVGAEVCNQE